MKLFTKFLSTLVLVLSFNAAFAVGTVQHKVKSTFAQEINAEELANFTSEDFLALTPRKIRKITGTKLSLKEVVALKAAQKKLKKSLKNGNAPEISSGLYVVLAILGWGFVAIGLLSDWSGSDWIINLVLTALCWLPGVIHALVKKKQYFS